MKKRFSYQVRRGMTLGLAIAHTQIQTFKKLERTGDLMGQAEAQALRSNILVAAAQFEAYVAAAATEHSGLAASNVFEFGVMRSIAEALALTTAASNTEKAMQAMQAQIIKTLKNSFEQVSVKVTKAIHEGAQS